MRTLQHWRFRPVVLSYPVLLVLSAVAGVLLYMVPPAAGEEGAHGLPLTHVADIPLPGRATRLDYESYDPARHLLFIAHLGDGEVIAFDVGASRVIARIAGVSSVHGVLAIPELSRVFASASGTDEIVAIDEATLKIVARMPGGHYPDGMAYAPEVHKLYVSDETGNTETVIDVRSNQRVATIPLGGEVGNTQYDPRSQHIFVNVQTRNELIEIDPAVDRIVARVGLPGAEHNHGLLIDSQDRLAFIACQGNDKLLVFDMEARRIIQSFGIGRDPDVLAFDPAPGTLYVAGEAGIVSMFSVRGANIKKIGEGRLGPNAHVVAIDQATHHSFFALKDVGGSPVLRIMSSQ
ncbi:MULTISPECIES: YncE family protein [Paraburkholderia]|uniref:YncE family protein n=1 Tax=Paraburkholderia TaxID=1822464 RepID=UPI0004780A3E|nr:MULTISPECIES: YncE family protein [Paraburkholderia]MDH6153703.1 YVTN family beta-propeller protein [Paraburkholderia sp. WSM4179]